MQAEHIEAIKPPENASEMNSGTTKGEKGILGTLTLIYATTRNACKYAYDEIQYWKNMRKTFKGLENWFKRTEAKVQRISLTAKLLVTNGDDVFTKLTRAEKMFDLIEDVTIQEPRNFDRLITKVEDGWDTISNHENKLLKKFDMMTPSTDVVLGAIQGLLIDNGFADSSQFADMSIDQKTAIRNRIAAEQEQLAQFDTTMPEMVQKKIAELISSSIIAKSEVYYGWAVTSVSNIDTIAKKFHANGKVGVNATEAQTAWYGIEEFQANNYRLKHGLEELKVYNGILGYDVWDMAFDRAYTEINQMRLDNWHMSMLTTIRKADEEYKKKFGFDRPKNVFN